MAEQSNMSICYRDHQGLDYILALDADMSTAQEIADSLPFAERAVLREYCSLLTIAIGTNDRPTKRRD
jgi:hypothetical protein